MRDFRQVSTELTFRCNAKCPACHRLKPLRVNLNDDRFTISFSNFKKLFHPGFLRNLEWLVLNGNFGDSIMNKEFRDIIAYVKEHDTKLNIHTNGGIHGEDYWTDVGNILTKNDIINFDIDGLATTHHVYRVNTKFENVFNNACTVIRNSEAKVHWKYIVFEHNKHQVEEARELAISSGFTSFDTVTTNRDFNRPKDGEYQHIKRITDLNKEPRQIICAWANYGKWYVSPEGLVFRCCWTGGHYYDKNRDRFFYPPDFENKFNGFNYPIEDILGKYQYWDKLTSYLQGYERSFNICKSQCGKIVSSSEKLEENLKTGTKTIAKHDNSISVV